MKTEIIVFGQNGSFIPAVCGEVVYTTDAGGCGVLEFDAVKEGKLDYKEGECVAAVYDGKIFFKGWVFGKSRDKQGIIHTTCYDQLRYFKNKDSCTYYNKTAAQLLKMLAADYGLKTGAVEETGYVIPCRIEDGVTLFDMMGTALDLTRRFTGKEYVMFDDCGSICLKSADSMFCDYFVCSQNCIDFNYTSSIDRDTYNDVHLVHSDKRSGIYNVYHASHAANIGRFGRLGYYAHISDDVNGAYMANEILAQHNRVGRFLKVKAMGDLRLRAGSVVRVLLDLGDFTQDCFMRCSHVSHILDDQSHIMYLTLKGGEFVYEQ